MTAVEYLFETLWDCPKDKLTWYTILEKAKEMEKAQIIDAYNKSFELRDKPYSTANKYYTSTYGSKGSDECHFEQTTNTSSATICRFCGREKFLHKQ